MSNEQSATVIENQLQTLVLRPVREQSGACLKVLSKGEFLIGSAEHCDFQLSFDGIAPEHCKLEYDGNRAILHAIDSRIWVNDGPANGISLRKKDRISIGPINFIFEYSQAEQPASESTTTQDEDTLQSEDQLLQSLQRAISQGRIDASAVAALNPEATSADSASTEKVLDELNQAIRQSQKQQAEHQQELNQLQEKSAEKIDQLQGQLTEQLNTTQQHELDLSGKQSEVEQLSKQFEDRIEQLTAREQKLQETLRIAKEVEKEWREREQNYLAEQEQFEQQLNSLEDKLIATAEQVKSEEDSNLKQQLQQEKQTWEQEQKQLEEELKQQVSLLQEEVVTAQQQVSKLEEQIAPLEKQVCEIQERLQETEEQFQQEKTTTKELQQQLKQAIEIEQEQQREQIAAREQAEQERDAAIVQLSQVREQETCELEKLQKAIAQKQAETESLQQELKQLTEQQVEVNEQKLKNAAEQEMIEAAREELETEKEAFSQARKDIQEIREEVEREQQNLQQQLEAIETERAEFTQEQKQAQDFAASPEEEAMETKILEDHYCEQEDIEEAPEEVSPCTELETDTELETEVEPADEQPTLDLDLDLTELSSMLNGTEPAEEFEAIASSSEAVETGIEELDSEASESCEMENAEGETETENSQEGDDVLDLRGELAKMFGLDQTESANESAQQMADVADEPVESETMESSPAITEEQYTEEPEQAVSETSPEEAEDPDSISAYMQALFERTSGKQEYTEPAVSPKTEQEEKSSQPEQHSPIAEPSVTEESEVDSLPAEPLAPIVEIDRESMAMDIASLRDVANQTARSALCTHAWKQLRVKVLLNGTLTVAGGVASAVLLTAPLWGSQSYTGYGMITLLLSSVSAIELIRANMMVSRLKAGTAAASEQRVNDECEPEQK